MPGPERCFARSMQGGNSRQLATPFPSYQPKNSGWKAERVFSIGADGRCLAGAARRRFRLAVMGELAHGFAMPVTPETTAFDRGIRPLLQIVLPDRAEAVLGFRADAGS